MSYAVFLTLFFLTFYIGYGMFIEYKRELRSLLLNIAVLSIAIIWAIYVLMFLSDYKKLETFFYVLFIFIICFTIYKIYLLSLTKPLDIVAQQQNYWGIDPQDIYNKNDWRLDEREDRVEVIVNPLQKQIYRRYSNNEEYITGNIFKEIQDLKFTTVKKVEDIKSELYLRIIAEFKKIIKKLELKNEFDELLKKNDYIVEFFLINCWEIYTQRVNLGIATLDILAKNFTERELLGALDNAVLSSVKRHGAGLYFKYMEFKNFLPVEKPKDTGDDNFDYFEDEDF